MGIATRPKTLRRKVYDHVREDLRQGKIGPDVLLVERELAHQLGVSRTPVREALYALEQDGFVRSTARGFQPRQLTDVEISHIFEMRQLLEPHAVASVAKSAGAGFQADLSAALEAQKDAHARDDPAAFMAGNHLFRDAWLKRLANKRLAAAIALYDDHILALRRNTLHDEAVRRIAIASLTAVLGAVSAKDEGAILQRYKEHLEKAEAAMRATCV